MKKAAVILAFGILFSFLAPLAETSVSVYAAAGLSGFELSADDRGYLDSIKDTPISFAITSEMVSFINSKGEKSGILQPLIGLLEDQWGLTVEIANVGLEEAFQRLSAGEVDMIGLSILSESRKKLYDHTEVLFNPTMDIYTYKDAILDSVVDIKGQTVGFLSDSVLPEILEVYLTPEGGVKYYKTIPELISALERGEIFCIATTLMIQDELLRHPDVNYKLSVESVIAPQVVYSSDEKLTPLIEMINRYLKSSEGGVLLAEIDANRQKCTIEKYGEYFKEDIDYIKANYDKLRIFDSGTLYPLSYVQNGEYYGLQKEIYDVMQELTGIPVEILDFSDFEGAEYSLTEALKGGKLHAVAGVYRSGEFDSDPAFEYSVPLMTDMLSFYVKQSNTVSSLSEMRIGSHDFSSSYMRWNIPPEQETATYNSLDTMMADLRGDKLDAVFIGEMMTDYYYTILNDYTLKRFDNLTVPASVQILYGSGNKSFNRLMDAVIRMQIAATPVNRQNWNNHSQNSKFEMMWLRSQMDIFRSRTFVAAVFFVIALTLLLAFAMYQLFKFSSFNKQITRMLSVQGNADMFWGNLKTGRIISKGNYPISKKLGFSQAVASKLVDIESLKNDLGAIDVQGLEYYMRDIELKPENSEAAYYFRRFAHKISESEFMVYVMDFTAEKYREQELSRLANTDYLTKLLNRRAMDELLSQKAADISDGIGDGGCNKIWVFMLDIDDFKQVNDRYGHNVGDRVLVVLARIIESHMTGGYVARWGGEEFLCVAELASLEKAMELAWNILYEFESAEITIDKTNSFTATISCGISELAEKEVYMAAVTRADMALYQAKCDGKNCVRFIGADVRPDIEPEFTEAVGVSATYDRVMSRLVQAFFHIRNTDSVIMEMLKIITIYNTLDRAYVFEKTGEGFFERTYLYDPDNLISPYSLNKMTVEDVLRFGGFNMEVPEPRFYSDAAARLSEEELKMRAKGLKSFAQLPIFSGGEFIGMVGFDSCKETHEWTNDEYRMLCDAAAILGEFMVRKKLERKLTVSKDAMTAILESIDDYVYAVGFETKTLLFANKKARIIINEADINKKTCWEVLYSGIDGPCEHCMHKYLVDEGGEPTGKTEKKELYYTRLGLWFEAAFTLIDWEDGAKAAVMVCRDITALKSGEMRREKTLDAISNETDITGCENIEETRDKLLSDLQREKEKHALLLEMLQSQELKTTLAMEGANSYSWEYTPEMERLVLGKTAEQALGYELAYFEQKYSRYVECIVFSYIPETMKMMRAYIDGETDIYTSEYPMNTAGGAIKWYLARGRYAEGKRDVIYGVCIDITESKLHEQKLAERAYRDSLTNMFNKQYILDGLMKPISDRAVNLGGILLDVRRFKNINEAFGYDYGDKLIEKIADRLREIFSGKQMARISGNRFLAVFENTGTEVLEGYAKQVTEDFKRPMLIDGRLIGVDFKIGIAINKDIGVAKLLKATEVALYSAKESLMEDYRVLSDDISLAFKRKVSIEFELRNAIKNQEFMLYFQPAMYTSTRRIAGAEALIRWKHPQLGIVPPMDFIPLAEDNGLIVPIGYYIISESAKQLRQWLDEGLDIYISFNLSARQFLAPQLKSIMQDTINKYNIPKHRLVAEITESAMISDMDYAKQILQEFESFGIGISLDDFGTGYSSMNYLGKIPLKHLKIDKSFIENATTIGRDRAILESIVTMSHKLGFQVTAEGVETEEQLALIEELGCDIIQGFYLSEPLTKEKFEAFVKSAQYGVILR